MGLGPVWQLRGRVTSVAHTELTAKFTEVTDGPEIASMDFDQLESAIKNGGGHACSTGGMWYEA